MDIEDFTDEDLIKEFELVKREIENRGLKV